MNTNQVPPIGRVVTTSKTTGALTVRITTRQPALATETAK